MRDDYLLVKFARERSGVAAIEFAIGAPLLFLIMFGIINLGYFGLSSYDLNQGVIAAARAASIETSNGFAASPNLIGSSSICPTQQHIQTIFQQATTPGIPQASMPSIQIAWGGSMSVICSPAAQVQTLPGGWVSVNVTYNWKPLIGGYLFGNGFPISASSTDQVMLAPAS
jgi:hypothetical protein